MVTLFWRLRESEKSARRRLERVRERESRFTVTPLIRDFAFEITVLPFHNKLYASNCSFPIVRASSLSSFILFFFSGFYFIT